MARSPGLFGSRRAVAVAALVCIALMLISVNIIVDRFFDARLDLTDQHLYTLSSGTLHTLAQIDEPITLRLYYSTRLGDAVPAYGVLEQRVRELLDQYVAAADGKLRLEVFNPQPYSAVEDQAVAFGLQAAPLDSEGDQVYFGLAGTNSTDDQQIISFFSPDRQRFLEYDLTKLVHSLAFPKKPVVGLISSLPLNGNIMAAMQGQQSQPMAVIQQLRELDKVEPLASDISAIPKDVDVLMLAQPQHLLPKTLFAIDQFVLKGGKALIFVDPHSEMQAAEANQEGPGASTASNLVPLFKAWGLQMSPKYVAGDRRDGQEVDVPTPGHGGAPLDYVAWLDLNAANLNRSDMVTADLNHIDMASAGILQPLPGAKTKIEPLIWTSRDSEKIPVEMLDGMPDVAGLLDNFKPSGKRYILAAHVTGMVDTAFPDGPPKPAAKPAAANAKPGAAKPAPGPTWLKRSAHPINVVVVADTDMLDDRMWVQSQDFFGQQMITPFANNGDFVANAIDVLSGGEDLIGLRSRGTATRPFVVVDRIRREAQARYSAEERTLQTKLKNTEAQLADLTGKSGTNTPAALSPTQSSAVEQFRAAVLQTRRQLREVQGALRQNIERLKRDLEFFDIALVPILVAVAAIVVGAVRLKRRRRRTAEV
jgi:gliding motility-associatede transport system auxiliary component